MNNLTENSNRIEIRPHPEDFDVDGFRKAAKNMMAKMRSLRMEYETENEWIEYHVIRPLTEAIEHSLRRKDARNAVARAMAHALADSVRPWA